MPIEEVSSNRDVPSVFDKVNSELLKVICTEMGDSLVYNPKTSKRKPASKPKPPAKKARKGTAAAPEAAAELPPEELALEVKTLADGEPVATRMKLWIDDMVAALSSLRDHFQCHDLRLKKTLASIFVSVSLEFAWTKKANLNNKNFTTWSSLRTALRTLLFETVQAAQAAAAGSASAAAHAESGLLGAACGGAEKKALDVEGAVQRLLAACQSSEPGCAGEASDSHSPSAEESQTSMAAASDATTTTVSTPLCSGNVKVELDPSVAVVSGVPPVTDRRTVFDVMRFVDEDVRLAGATPDDYVDNAYYLKASQVPEVAVPKLDSILLKIICLSVEQALYNRCYGPDALEDLKALNINLLDNPVTFKASSSSFKLWFAGPASTIRTQNSLPVCILVRDSLRVPLYVTGDRLMNLTSDTMVPAWCVKTDRNNASTDLGWEEVEVVLPAAVVEGSNKMLIMAPFLQPAAEFLDTDGAEWEVTRPETKVKAQRNASNRHQDLFDMLGATGMHLRLKEQTDAKPDPAEKKEGKSKGNKSAVQVQHLLK